MFALLLVLQGSPDPGSTYSGTAKQLDVHIPRFEAEAKIDGVLDEPVWSRAATLTGFSQYRPVDGRPAEDSTAVLVLTPEFTTKVDGAPTTPGYDYRGTPEVAGNLRWGLTQNLGLTATANPDFSQVEADIGQVTLNQRFALFYPEKRPFFLEGLEQFDTPNSLIYTRRIAQPVFGT